MPTPGEIADNLQQFGTDSPFYAAAEEDARKAAADALASQRRWEIETNGNDPFQSSPQTSQMVYLDFLRRARAARGLPQSMRSADLAGTFSGEGQQVETGILGGIKKGIQAGAMRVGALTASPFLSEEDTAGNLAAANKRSSEVQGLPAEIAGTIAQTGTEMAPLIAGSLATGGAVLPALGAGAARTAALGAASVGSGLQMGVPEYFERRGGSSSVDLENPEQSVAKPSMPADQAATVATLKGLSTASMTALLGFTGAQALANPVARKAVHSGFTELISSMAHGAAKESATQAADELTRAWIDKAVAGDDVTAADFATRAIKAGALGALFGAGGEAVAHAKEALQGDQMAPVAPSPRTAPVRQSPVTPAAGTPPPVSPRNVGVVLRGMFNGSIHPDSLTPESRSLVADTLRQQLPQGKPVPAEVQAMLDRLEPPANVKNSVPEPAVAPVVPAPAQGVVPPGSRSVPGKVLPENAEPVPAVAPARTEPSAATPKTEPTPVAAKSEPTPAPKALEPTPDLVAQLQELNAAHERAKQALATPEIQVPRETSAPKVGPKEVNQLADRGVRTGPAPEDPAERAQWEQRLSVDHAEKLLQSLGDNPKGLMKQVQAKLLRALGKTPVVERRLHEGGFTPKQALEERRAAPPVDTKAATERIVKKPAPVPASEPSTSAKVPLFITKRMEKELRGLGYKDEDLGPMTAKEANTILENGTPRRQFAEPKPQPKEISHAEEVRSHPEQIREEGNVEQVGKDQGSEDLQRHSEAGPEARHPQEQVAPETGRRPFDVREEPGSPTYVNRVRERVAEAINQKRKAGGTEIRPGVDPIIQELGDQPTVDTNAKASAAVRKRVVDEKAKVNGKETKIYESPNSWGKAINEYVGLHKKHGKLLRAEARTKETAAVLERSQVQLSELPPDAPADVRNRAVAVRDKAQATHEKSRSALTTAKSGKNPPSQAELARVNQLSQSIRGMMAESVAKQAAEMVRAAPADQRMKVAAQIEAKIKNGDLTDLVSNELVDPASLSGVNSRAFLADVENKFALVVPHPKKPGEYITLNRAGERDAKEPFVTDKLGDLLDLLSARDLTAPMETAESAAEGLHAGLSPSEIKAGVSSGVKVSDPTAAPKDWETPELYLNRVLMTDTNNDVNENGTKKIKVVPAAELESVLEKHYGAEGKKMLDEYVRVKAIEKRGDNYVALPMNHFYRRTGPSMNGSTSDGTSDSVISEQKQIEKAAVLFDLDVRTGMRHGVELPAGTTGIYDMNARSIALGQFDLGTFFHELGHDLSIAEIGKNSTPMPAVQNELAKVATDHGQPALMAEGAAELARLYVQDKAAAGRRYPDATKWFEGLLRDRGLKDRVDSIVEEHQKWLKASPEQRRKAAIISKQELESRDKTQKIGNLWTRVKTFLSTQLFDRAANLRSVSRELPAPKDAYDDAYEAKMLEAGWPKAAADSFLNGFKLDPRTGDRSVSFGQVMDEAKLHGITPDEFKNWQAYLAGMSIFDKSPRLRRKIFNRLGIDETKHGAWAIEGAYLPDPFDTLSEVHAANQEMDLQWEQKAAQNKALGKPPPPKPVHYKLKDPSPGTSENAPTNFTDAQLEDFANIIKKHDSNSAFHQLAETHMLAINAMDTWKHSQGLMTAATLKLHREHAYYVPLRTESEGGQRVKIKGSGGAEILAPYEQLWDKVRGDHFATYSQAAPRAWLRYITGLKADRIAAGEQHLESEFPLAKLASFTSMDEAVRNYASIQAKIKRTGQESPVVDEYVVTQLDGDTVDALSAAGLINPLLVKDTNSLIGTHVAYRVEDPAIRTAIGEPAIPWTPAMHWILRGPSNVLRKLATSFNPEFWIKTVIRDTYQAGLQTAAGRNPLRFLGTSGKGVMDAYTNASNLSSDRAKTDPIYAAFVQSGVTSSSLLADSNNVTSVLGSHDLSRALSMMGAAKPKFGWLRSAMTPLNRVADTVEGFNRASEFRRVIADGLAQHKVADLAQLSPRQAKSILINAARSAQEVTVNFRRMGAWSPIRSINELVPFFNATIQGSMRGLKTLAFQARFPGESLGKRMVNGLTVYTMLALPVLLQHMMLEDKEEKDQYSELPDYERMLFYHFPAGKTADGRVRFVKIPKPQGPFTGAIAAMEKMAQDDPRTWHDIAVDTYGQTAPQSYVPTALQLGVELFGGPRMGAPGSMGTTPYRLEGVEGDAQDTPWLSPSSYTVSHALEALGIPGASPLKVENLLRGYTGGLGWTVLDVPPMLQDMVGKSDRASYDPGSYPVTRLMLAKDPAFSSRSISRAYDLLDVLNNSRKTYEQEVSKAEMGQQTPEQTVANILNRPMTGFGKQADDELADFRSQMIKARTMWENINRDKTMDPIQRRIAMDHLVDQMVNASRMVYNTVGKVASDMGINLQVPRRQ